MRLTPAIRALAPVIGGSLALFGGALFLALNDDGAPGSLFTNPVTLQVLAALVAWALLAWLARWLAIGDVPEKPLGALGLIWGGFRVSLLFAVVAMLGCWLLTLAFGHSLQPALLRAFVLLLAFTAITGAMGGAIINSLLAASRWFGQPKAGAK